MNANTNSHDEGLKKSERLAYLIAGHIRGTLTEPEQDELDAWIVESDENLELFEKLTDEDNIEIAMQQHFQIEKEKADALLEVKSNIEIKQKPNLARRIWPYLVAASLIIVISLFIIKRSGSSKDDRPAVAQGTQNKDVSPGSNKAVLLLSNGRTILLDSIAGGLLANEGNVNIKKGNDGQIVYEGTDQEMKYNTVSTPRGGQYKLVLGDGTKVWLNAESSIKFPAGFTKSQRNVELRGEAYFEVAKNPESPFRVKIISPTGDSSNLEVLGTHFNINAYADESVVKTTLLEGSVKLEKNDHVKILKPGEQGLISDHIEVLKADVNESIAWKNGKFLFRDQTVHSIGEQIKRWYDVEVQYTGTITQHFNLEVSRDVPLSKLLDGFEGTAQVKFVLEDRKLIIKP